MGHWRRTRNSQKIRVGTISPGDTGWQKYDCTYTRQVVTNPTKLDCPTDFQDPNVPDDCCCYCIYIWKRTKLIDYSSSQTVTDSSSSSSISSNSSSSSKSSSSSFSWSYSSTSSNSSSNSSSSSSSSNSSSQSESSLSSTSLSSSSNSSSSNTSSSQSYSSVSHVSSSSSLTESSQSESSLSSSSNSSSSNSSSSNSSSSESSLTSSSDSSNSSSSSSSNSSSSQSYSSVSHVSSSSSISKSFSSNSSSSQSESSLSSQSNSSTSSEEESIMKIVYDWSSVPDLDIQVVYGSESVGWSCANSETYLSWGGDNTNPLGPETVDVDLKQAEIDNVFTPSNDAVIDLYGCWFSGETGYFTVEVTWRGVTQTQTYFTTVKNTSCCDNFVGQIIANTNGTFTLF